MEKFRKSKNVEKRTQLNISFIHICRNNNVIPNFVKTKLSHHINKEKGEHIRKGILNNELRSYYRKLNTDTVIQH